MRDSQLVIASKYNSCSSSSFICQKAVCFHKLEGKFWFQKSVIEVVFFVFNRILDHKRVHIPNIGSFLNSDKWLFVIQKPTYSEHIAVYVHETRISF